MKYYSDYQINDYSMTREAGSTCYGFGTGQSHERIIQSAGGEIGYGGFKDPRPGFDGPIYADRIFINQKTNQIQGINFVTKSGEFCCSYMGTSYKDIKDSNLLDLTQKQARYDRTSYEESESPVFNVTTEEHGEKALVESSEGSYFNKDNYKTYYRWERFKSLRPEQREELIKFSVEEIRKEKGLQEVHVDFEDADSTSRGYCYQNVRDGKLLGHEVRLNSDILTETHNYYAPYQIYNTINHELEHASQYEHASNIKIGNDDAATLEQRLNDQHYYSASGDKIVNGADGTKHREYRFERQVDYQMYRAQACEADARAAGYSAVESLKQEGQSDVYLDSYLKTEKAREINNNRTMMSRLGMHSRENMAKEELSHLSRDKVSEQDQARVLEYARQKDYETAKEVLIADSGGTASEEEMREQFDSNETYTDFYKSQQYNDKKVTAEEHKNYSYAQYKWADVDSEEAFFRQFEDKVDTNADEDFLRQTADERTQEGAEDADFFESFDAGKGKGIESSTEAVAEKLAKGFGQGQ